MAKIRMPENTEYWWGSGETGSLTHCGWSIKFANKSVGISYKVKHINLPYGPPIPLLDIFSREVKTHVHKNTFKKCSWS